MRVQRDSHTPIGATQSGSSSAGADAGAAATSGAMLAEQSRTGRTRCTNAGLTTGRGPGTASRCGPTSAKEASTANDSISFAARGCVLEVFGA